MRLIYDLLYEILAYAEQYDDPGPYKAPKKIDGYTGHQIDYHIRMCEQADWLTEGKTYSAGRDKYPHYTKIGELTWEGHQELKRLRNGG